MKLNGSTKCKITNDDNGENVAHFEITELILIHCNILAMIISKIQESCTLLFLISRLINFIEKSYILKNF